jgi:mannose-1-phosphate guanylyltransferase
VRMSFEQGDQVRDVIGKPSANHNGAARSRNGSISQLIVPVVLSGGGGTRLWPYSTSETPKQFLKLLSERSLFEETFSRVSNRQRFVPPIVVSNANHADHCEHRLGDCGSEARLILEPCARNTAPAIVLSACIVGETYGEDALMLVMPSDHMIDHLDKFDEAIAAAQRAATGGNLVTFGVQPTSPETGYGYIETGAEIPDAPGVHSVGRFVEKPAVDLAEAMVAGGLHLWNIGIFLFKAGVILSEIKKFAPNIWRSAAKSIELSEREGIRVSPPKSEFENCPSDSIDYAVMERSECVAVVPMSPGWSDLGSWDAVAAMQGTETSSELITAVDCADCYIRSDGLQIGAVGVKNLIIVASKGRLLIKPRGSARRSRSCCRQWTRWRHDHSGWR